MSCSDLFLTALLFFPQQNPLLLAEKKVHKPKNDAPGQSSVVSKSSTSSSNRPSALDELMIEEEMYKEMRNRKDYWMAKGIEVKLIHHKLPRNILYRHAVVLNMEDNYTVGLVKAQFNDYIVFF